MRRWLRRAEALLALVGAALFLGVGALLALEHSGVLTRLVSERLERESGGALAVESVGVHWRGGALSLRGVALADGPQLARVERLLLRPGWRAGGFALSHLQVLGAKVQLGPSLDQALTRAGQRFAARAQSEGRPERASDGELDLSRIPPATGSNLEVLLELPGGNTQPLGTATLWWMPEAERPRLAGYFHGRLGADLPSVGPVAVEGTLSGRAQLDLALSAADLEVPPGALPHGLWERYLDLREAGGRLSVHGRASVALDGSLPPRARVEFALSRWMWASGDDLLRARDAELNGWVELAPPMGAPWLAWDSFAGELGLTAHWNEGPLDARLRLGRRAGNGQWASLDLVAPAVPVGSQKTLRTVRGSTGPRTSQSLAEAFDALRPGGVAGLHLRVAFPETLDLLERESPPEPEVVLVVDTAGSTEMRFEGWPADDGRRQGFPVPLSEIRGQLVYAHLPNEARRDRFAILALEGRAPEGAVRLRGAIVSPETDWVLRRPEVRLRLAVDQLPVDRELREALIALDLGFDPVGDLWLEGGSASADVWFEQHERNGGMLLAADVELQTTAAPLGGAVSLDPLDGRVRVRFAPWQEPTERGLRRPMGTAVRARATARAGPEDRGATDAGTPLSAEGAWRERPQGVALWARAELGPLDARSPLAGALLDGAAGQGGAAEIEGRMRDLDLAASLWISANAAIAQSMHKGAVGPVDTATPAGFGAIEWTADGVSVGRAPARAEGWRASGVLWRAGDPLDLVLSPGVGPALRGTGALCGPLPAGALGAATFGLSGDGLRGELAAARVDPSAKALRAALAALSRAPATDADAELLPAGLALSGRFDGAAAVELSSGGELGQTAVALHLRGQDLVAEEFSLKDLSGRVDLAGGRVHAPRLEARYGDTELLLEDVELFRRTPFGTWLGAGPKGEWPGGAETETLLGLRLSFADLPLDGERLAQLGATVTGPDSQAGAPPMSWRMQLDARDVEVLVGLSASGKTAAWLEGELLPHDVHLDLGLPLGLSSARVHLERVVIEDGDARGWGRAEDVYANLAGHSIEAGRFVATYTAGRLTVDDLVARYAGGSITSLGTPFDGDAQPSLRAPSARGRALSIDLVEGGRFDLALALNGLDVRRILAGLTPGELPSGGRVTGAVRMSGLPEDPLSLLGAGVLRIDQARLGSVPVARAVFTALGFDGTATFDRGESRFRVMAGKLLLDSLEIRSPLLQLVGKGSMGLDGALNVDLDVEYSVLEALGPLGRLVYWFQNRLLRVSVRGDLDRPRVRARNILVDLLGDSSADRPILPLPSPSALPQRF